MFSQSCPKIERERERMRERDAQQFHKKASNKILKEKKKNLSES